jgi:hypothetical protein
VRTSGALCIQIFAVNGVRPNAAAGKTHPAIRPTGEHQPAFGLGQESGDSIGEAVAGNSVGVEVGHGRERGCTKPEGDGGLEGAIAVSQ